MRSFRFVCSFAVLLIALIAAQPSVLAAAPAGSAPLIFLPVVDYPGGDGAFSVAVADVNGDSKPDLIVAGPGGVSVLRGNGDGTFQAAVTYSSGGYNATSVAVGDVNGDGKLDLVVANSCQSTDQHGDCIGLGQVGVLLGNGDGTFQSPVGYDTGGYYASSVAIADLDGNGHQDVVVTNICAGGGNCGFYTTPGQVAVLMGNGDGTFQPAVVYDSFGYGASSVAIGDVNGDGKFDVLVANQCSAVDCPQPQLGDVGVLLGGGNGTLFGNGAYSSGGVSAASVAIGDVNGDGHPDLVVANVCQNSGSCGSGDVSVLLGNGDGTFQSPVSYTFGLGSTSMAIADVNEDGHLDLLVVGGGVGGAAAVLLGNGDGTFQTPVNLYSTGGNQAPGGIAVSDVNGDGKPDLLVANGGVGSNTVGVLLNNSGAPSSTTSLASSTNPVNLRKTVTYTATVATQAGGSLTGMVTFQDGFQGGPTTIATVPLTNNQATYSASYTLHQVGPHTITATYGGDLHVATGSQAAPLTEYVRNVASKTVLTTSASPSLVGQPVTFTATITPHKGQVPDGELVTFFSGKTTLGTSTTANGIASLTTSFSKAKTYSIKANYPGDNVYEPSSGTVKQIVNK